MSEEQPDLLAAVPPPATNLSIFELLSRRFPAGEWAYFEEVRQKPGAGRSADSVAVNLWSSRGYAICGFEVKVTRSDWLRELKDPSKAQPIFEYCDRWALVAEKGIVKEGEIPDTWGHIEKRGQTLYEVKAAPKLQAKPLTREFFASLIRRGHETLERRAEIMVRTRSYDEQRRIEARAKSDIEAATRRHTEYRARVDKFFKDTGLDLERHHEVPDPKLIAFARRLTNMKNWKGADFGKLDDLAAQLDIMSAQLRAIVADPALQLSLPADTENPSESEL